MIEFGIGILIGFYLYKIHYESHYLEFGSVLKNMYYKLKADMLFRNGLWRVGDYFAEYHFNDYEHSPEEYRRLYQITEVWDTEIKYIMIDCHKDYSGKSSSFTNSLMSGPARDNVMRKYTLIKNYVPYIGKNKFTKSDQFKEDLNDVLAEDE